MRKRICQGTLLTKRRRCDKGDTFTVTDIIDTRREKVYILKCYKTGKTKALRRSSLSEYRIIKK